MRRMARLGVLLVVVLLFMAMAAPASAQTVRFEAVEIGCVTVDPGQERIGPDGALHFRNNVVASTMASADPAIDGSVYRVNNGRVDLATGVGQFYGYGTIYPAAIPGGAWEFTYIGQTDGLHLAVMVSGHGVGVLAGYSVEATLHAPFGGCSDAGGVNYLRGTYSHD